MVDVRANPKKLTGLHAQDIVSSAKYCLVPSSKVNNSCSAFANVHSLECFDTRLKGFEEAQNAVKKCPSCTFFSPAAVSGDY